MILAEAVREAQLAEAQRVRTEMLRGHQIALEALDARIAELGGIAEPEEQIEAGLAVVAKFAIEVAAMDATVFVEMAKSAVEWAEMIASAHATATDDTAVADTLRPDTLSASVQA